MTKVEEWMMNSKNKNEMAMFMEGFSAIRDLVRVAGPNSDYLIISIAEIMKHGFSSLSAGELELSRSAIEKIIAVDPSIRNALPMTVEWFNGQAERAERQEASIRRDALPDDRVPPLVERRLPEMSVRLQNILSGNGLSLRDCADTSMAELRQLPGMGKVTLRELMELIDAFPEGAFKKTEKDK